MMKMKMKKKTRRNIRYKLVEGFVPGVTWGLNLMLGEAPPKGTVGSLPTHLSNPFTIFWRMK
jgi:hypothetical protein